MFRLFMGAVAVVFVALFVGVQLRVVVNVHSVALFHILIFVDFVSGPSYDSRVCFRTLSFSADTAPVAGGFAG